ncbi:TlpA family protein disulfide reductase [Ilyomonas limi]|uniref:TlpA family protein disulfide reductase n=1 Tax=Ilyomonas limi TaxID=2575867 RepID=A0A4U3L2P2_9BACT|nr:TlpA disulfide reductase family protein [Ilyomonas limi]TKK69298.1 TlpA family protein disulfide reductase [Ilyomonas limi]
MTKKLHGLKTLLLCLSLCIIYNDILAQKQFAVTIELPQQLDIKKLRLSYDNGKGEINIKNPVVKNNVIFVSQPYYAKYAAIILRYPEPNSEFSNYYRYFFVADQPAIITLYKYDSTQSPFDNYQLSNALDFKSEQERMHQYDSLERKELDDYTVLFNEGKTGAANDSIAGQILSQKIINWNKRDLEFVRKNPNSYYSFWFFRKWLIQSAAATSGSLLTTFNTTFPDTFRNGEEGATIKKFLQGRIGVHKNSPAPDFTSKDSSGKIIALKDYLGKKDVLLVFWATWCVPCMQEVPAIKEIHDQYPPEKLEIISVAFPSDYATFSKVIKEKDMNWINIYNDLDVINSYGGYQGIPRVYLIDRSGKIVYERNEDDPGDLQLTKLKKVLKSNTLN